MRRSNWKFIPRGSVAEPQPGAGGAEIKLPPRCRSRNYILRHRLPILTSFYQRPE
jgi:hypothetical protein